VRETEIKEIFDELCEIREETELKELKQGFLRIVFITVLMFSIAHGIDLLIGH